MIKRNRKSRYPFLESGFCIWFSQGFTLSETLTKCLKNGICEEIPISGKIIIFENKSLMRVIAKSTLPDFWINHKDCEQQLKSWFNEAERGNWYSPADIKTDYPSASILPCNRVVFNIKGNSYRLIVKINYKAGVIWIRFVGTHKEYDQINAETI